MTSEESPSDDATGGSATPDTDDGTDERSSRPLLAGAIGLLAGLLGGIAATTLAPGNLFLTILLIVIVVLIVTLGTLRVLAR